MIPCFRVSVFINAASLNNNVSFIDNRCSLASFELFKVSYECLIRLLQSISFTLSRPSTIKNGAVFPVVALGRLLALTLAQPLHLTVLFRMRHIDEGAGEGRQLLLILLVVSCVCGFSLKEAISSVHAVLRVNEVQFVKVL